MGGAALLEYQGAMHIALEKKEVGFAPSAAASARLHDGGEAANRSHMALAGAALVDPSVSISANMTMINTDTEDERGVYEKESMEDLRRYVAECEAKGLEVDPKLVHRCRRRRAPHPRCEATPVTRSGVNRRR